MIAVLTSPSPSPVVADTSLRTIDNPCSIFDAQNGLCQRGDVIVEQWAKGLFVGLTSFPVIFWDVIDPTNERFLAVCETFDQRTRFIRRKTGGTTHNSPRKRAPHNGNEVKCREIERCQRK